MNLYLALMTATSLAFSVAPVAASNAPLDQPGTVSSAHTYSPTTSSSDVRQPLAPATVTNDFYDWSAATVPASPVWPADEPIGHFTVLAMILPVFLMLCTAIFVVNFAYRSIRAQTRREHITYRARTSAKRSAHGHLAAGGRVALLHIG